MDAVFRVKADEFDEVLFQRIKEMLTLKDNLEITISISESSGILRNETKGEYFNRLLKAREHLDNNQNIVTLKADQLDEFEKFLLNEP